MAGGCEQISALSVMKDEQRLALLKEVGGTKIYEERRRDSLKMMAETEGRQLRIQEVVSTLGYHPRGVRPSGSRCQSQGVGLSWSCSVGVSVLASLTG